MVSAVMKALAAAADFAAGRVAASAAAMNASWACRFEPPAAKARPRSMAAL